MSRNAKTLGERQAFPGPVIFSPNHQQVMEGGAFFDVGGLTVREHLEAQFAGQVLVALVGGEDYDPRERPGPRRRDPAQIFRMAGFAMDLAEDMAQLQLGRWAARETRAEQTRLKLAEEGRKTDG